MEIIFAIAMVISLAGNILQHGSIIELKSENAKLEHFTEANYNAFEKAKEANNGYKEAVIDLQDSNKRCESLLDDEIEKFNDWQIKINSDKESVDRLKENLDTIDFGDSCRVPEWVDFETSEEGNGSR